MFSFSNNELLDLTFFQGGHFAIRTKKEAFAFCTTLANTHYENFPVGSVLIPRDLRAHFYSVYAFSRLADDIADELPNTSANEKRAALERLEALLFVHAPDELQNPIFRALHATMREKNIPPLPFQKLLQAFRMDSEFQQARHWEELEYYCAHSANPVGELVLRLYGIYSPTLAPLSDAVCTALQLTNFWQDFSRDIPQGRIFIPQDILQEFGLSSEDIRHFHAAPETISTKIIENQFLPCFQLLFHKTKLYFADGSALLSHIADTRLRAELALTISGGETVLKAAYNLGFRILHERPKLSKYTFPRVLWRAVRLFGAS
ncbi:MAG: squalene synthase HpnC [Candidatus Kapaibacterium sp.]|nr:MAG: squalene synthase HpnC [Candidatus Kapabacteria bacterium]